MTIEYPLQMGAVALIDDEDADRVLKYTWMAFARHSYVRMTNKTFFPRHLAVLHRFILRAPRDALVDHVNGNGLDNRRANLRLCTHAENMRNRGVSELYWAKTSRFKGVSLDPEGGRWRAAIGCDKQNYHLGSFREEEEAARAYDEAAARLHREFARTNRDLGLLP